MHKKKYIIIFIVIYLILVPIIAYLLRYYSTKQSATSTSIPAGVIQTGSYTSNAPNSQAAALTATLIVTKKGSIDTFAVRNIGTGLVHTLYTSTNSKTQFETVLPQNWSATNRFVYVFVDTNGIRNLLFFQSDGKFTDAQYFRQPITLLPHETIISANWATADELICTKENMQTGAKTTYSVSFDDSTGYVSQCSSGPKTCEIDDD